MDSPLVGQLIAFGLGIAATIAASSFSWYLGERSRKSKDIEEKKEQKRTACRVVQEALVACVLPVDSMLRGGQAKQPTVEVWDLTQWERWQHILARDLNGAEWTAVAGTFDSIRKVQQSVLRPRGKDYRKDLELFELRQIREMANHAFPILMRHGETAENYVRTMEQIMQRRPPAVLTPNVKGANEKTSP